MNCVRYTPFGVDPKEVHGEDPHLHWHAGASVDMPCRALRASFPGETFRVLKEKEVKQFGEWSHWISCLDLQGKVDILMYNTHKV
jgi:hypothetical protein